MGQVLPNQHPAVVLRSHFKALRALLAVALIAVVGLTVAVVILATDEQPATDASTAAPIGQIHYGEFNPATGAPESVSPLGSHAQGTAGPDESKIGVAIGSGDAGSTATGGPDESVVADAVSGR